VYWFPRINLSTQFVHEPRVTATATRRFFVALPLAARE
jgi:hypothetical protein